MKNKSLRRNELQEDNKTSVTLIESFLFLEKSIKRKGNPIRHVDLYYF